MGWFDEQIKQRKARDNDTLQDAYASLARAILGENAGFAPCDARMQAKGAIDEILAYYHFKGREIPDHVQDIDQQLEYLLRPHGVMRRRVTLDQGWYKHAVGPLLAMCQDGSVVALIPNSTFGYTFRDAVSGKRMSVNEKTAQLFDGDAIGFSKPFPLERISNAQLLKYIWQAVPRGVMAMLVVATLLSTLVSMLTPKITQLIFSTVIESGSLRLLFAITVFSLGVTISSLMIKVISNLLLSRISTQLDVYVQAATMARVFNLPAAFFKDYSAGELASITSHVNALSAMLVNSLFSSGITSLFSLIYIGQIFSFAPALALPAVAVVLVTLVLTLSTTTMECRRQRKLMELSAKNSGMTYSLLTGVQKVKLAGAEKRAFSRWLQLYAQEARVNYRPPILVTLSPALTALISAVGSIVIYYFAIESKVGVADYYAFTSAYGMVSGAFASLAALAATIAQIKPVLEKIRPIFDAVPEFSAEKSVVSRLSGGIELDNVSFRYSDSMPMIVDGMSLKIRPGQYVAIVGKTGCGKSTLVRLMLGFESAQKGAIYYDGKNINGLDLKSLRSHIGAVIQNGKLFQGDIFSNIAISAPELTLDGAWEAAEMAGLADEIRQMPMGMNTMITEGSGGISGGQRQRLLIARAIASKPKILIFDEATSALDNITQKQVSDALAGLKCTRIVIAHRLSTIRQCDRILVLEGGKIVEDGNYEELVAKNGIFADLVERQRLDT